MWALGCVAADMVSRNLKLLVVLNCKERDHADITFTLEGGKGLPKADGGRKLSVFYSITQ